MVKCYCWDCSLICIGVVLAVIVGFTGFYNSVHYASDVVAGVLIGLIISWYIIKKKII